MLEKEDVMPIARLVAMVVSFSTMAVFTADMACAQNFPQKPIRLATTGTGGSSDIASRIIAQEISAPLGQPVIVENRAANVLPESVAKAPADGYTLMITVNRKWCGRSRGRM